MERVEVKRKKFRVEDFQDFLSCCVLVNLFEAAGHFV